MIEHIVVMRLRPDHDPDEYAAVIEGLDDLIARLPGVLRFKAGPNRDYEKLSVGYDAGFVVTFSDFKSLNRYANHSEHKALAARLVDLCLGGVTGLMVFDLDTKAL